MTNNTTAPDLIERAKKDAWLSRAASDPAEMKRAELMEEVVTALEAEQARIAELEGALASCRQSAIWTPYHPACKTVIETVNAALQEGKE